MHLLKFSSLCRIAIPLVLVALAGCTTNTIQSPPAGDELFSFKELSPRWSSPENPTSKPGAGATENYGAKGRPSVSIAAGESLDLLNVTGTGIINRMWITISDRSPEMLRALKLEMFWDGESKPAVSVPFGDFFCVGLGRTATFENELFANPEGRSFNCFIPMPFKKSAVIRITNESGRRLDMIFFDVNFQLIDEWHEEFLYFHSYWNRDTATALAVDFEMLPAVTGKGRFLGVNVGVITNPAYGNTWWGEGEVKIYLDGTGEQPTLVGTGTEDYIGTAWGQGRYANRYTGSLIADPELRQWSFYRLHIPDPIYFRTDCRVTLQQMGGSPFEQALGMQENGTPMIPVTIAGDELLQLYRPDSIVDLKDPSLPKNWTNFYRSDDVSSTAYFYLSTPSNDLPGLQPLPLRTVHLNAPE